MFLTEEERTLIELAREHARQGTDESMKRIAPLLDKLVGEDKGPYAKPTDSPDHPSLTVQLDGLRERGFIGIKRGDVLSPELQAKMQSIGQPLPVIKTDGSGEVSGPPPPIPITQRVLDAANRHGTPNDYSTAEIARAQLILDAVNRHDVPPMLRDQDPPQPLQMPMEQQAAASPVATQPIPVANLVIRKPARDAMIANGIRDLRDLAGWRRSELKTVKGVGVSVMGELADIMRHEGVRFRNERPKSANRTS